jgi:hypothetical protein
MKMFAAAILAAASGRLPVPPTQVGTIRKSGF